MRKYIPAVLILAVIVGVIFLLAIPRGGPDDGAVKPGVDAKGPLVIISPNSQDIEKEFERAFVAWHEKNFGGPCAVEWRDHGGGSEALRYIVSEFARSPEGIGVDIFWGGGIEPSMRLAKEGMLQKVDLPANILAGIPDTVGGVPVYDTERRWFGTALSGFGIMYNRRRIALLKLPEPETWEDLCAAGFFGEVGAADPRASGSAQTMVEVILQAYGWEKGYSVLTRMAGNVKGFTRSASDILDLVSKGDVAAGLAIDFYAWVRVKQYGKDKIGYVLPEELTPITPDAIGILKGAPHLPAAQRFVQFVLSSEGQRLWVLPVGVDGGPTEHELLRIPVLPEVYKRYADVTSVAFDPSRAHQSFKYDPDLSAQRRDALKDLYGVSFIDLSPELIAAWKAIIARGSPEEEVRQLCRPPVTAEQLLKLSAEWSDPQVRNDTKSEWTRTLQERYKALSR